VNWVKDLLFFSKISFVQFRPKFLWNPEELTKRHMHAKVIRFVLCIIKVMDDDTMSQFWGDGTLFRWWNSGMLLQIEGRWCRNRGEWRGRLMTPLWVPNSQPHLYVADWIDDWGTGFGGFWLRLVQLHHFVSDLK
jgi:hypothetical protein